MGRGASAVRNEEHFASKIQKKDATVVFWFILKYFEMNNIKILPKTLSQQTK
jgi:hypothetical protein